MGMEKGRLIEEKKRDGRAGKKKRFAEKLMKCN